MVMLMHRGLIHGEVYTQRELRLIDRGAYRQGITYIQGLYMLMHRGLIHGEVYTQREAYRQGGL